jgi:acetylornithine/N-succinyldiaminopimelate aminotransferase
LLARAEVSCFVPGDQGSTFGGHPVMCAVGLAVTRALTAPGFLEHVELAGEQLSNGLTRVGAQYGAKGVRGAGLLWALRLPRAAGAAVVAAAHRDGLLINSPQPELLRFMPALNVTAEEIDSMLALLSGALHDAL